MAKALGRNVEEEYQPQTSTLAAHLRGDVGLLFTNRAPETIVSFF